MIYGIGAVISAFVLSFVFLLMRKIAINNGEYYTPPEILCIGLGALTAMGWPIALPATLAYLAYLKLVK